jgi:hypothetical protein
VGWEFVPFCVDGCTRMAYVEVLADERASTVGAFLERAVSCFTARGVHIQRVMTDNGDGYRSRSRSRQHPELCRRLNIKHLFTSPTGRARTGNPSASSAPSPTAGPTAPSTPPARIGAWRCRLHRPLQRQPLHRALNGSTPAQRLAERNNPAGAYI